MKQLGMSTATNAVILTLIDSYLPVAYMYRGQGCLTQTDRELPEWLKHTLVCFNGWRALFSHNWKEQNDKRGMTDKC